MNSYSWLADVILVVHLVYVLCVVLPIFLIPLGAKLGWKWVRNRTLRWVHLSLMAFVVIETLLGVICPLTVWEQRFRVGRGGTQGDSFVQYWVGQVLFYPWEPWVFTAIYLAMIGLIIFLYFRFPPERK